MATEPPQVDLGRLALTELHLSALEMALYHIADAMGRLRRDRTVYTKGFEGEIQYELPQGVQDVRV